MRRATYCRAAAVVACPLLALAAANQPEPTGSARPAASVVPPAGAEWRDLARNPRPTIEERLNRIERLSAQLQEEAQELRQDLHLKPPQTQPAGGLPDDLRGVEVHF